jgi:hypothetical protein
VTHCCFFDATYTNVPATKIATPEFDFVSSWVAKAASIYAITCNGLLGAIVFLLSDVCFKYPMTCSSFLWSTLVGLVTRVQRNIHLNSFSIKVWTRSISANVANSNMSSTYNINRNNIVPTTLLKIHGSVGVGVYPSLHKTFAIFMYHNCPDWTQPYNAFSSFVYKVPLGVTYDYNDGKIERTIEVNFYPFSCRWEIR